MRLLRFARNDIFGTFWESIRICILGERERFYEKFKEDFGGGRGVPFFDGLHPKGREGDCVCRGGCTQRDRFLGGVDRRIQGRGGDPDKDP